MPASLLNLRVRGVRSYSPYEHKAQNIEFMPLTLIVGSNGSGKTTVIESLKFIISGEEPPLSDSRRNFIHTTNNPSNSFDKNIPYASIELLFQNARGETCIAKREITTANTNRVTPSISSSYKIKNTPWRNVHKQDDWNKTVPLLFNLPNQAILNNVILCHQEDNLWCMADSSHVKQVFDKIFGCEQYKKEIKNIDAELKNCRAELVISEKETLYNSEKVKLMNTLTQQYQSFQAEINKIRSDREVLDLEIKNNTEAEELIAKDITRYEVKRREIDSLKQKLLDLKERDQNLRKSLRKPFIDPQIVSDAELNDRTQNHVKLVEETKRKQVHLKEREDLLKREISHLESNRVSLQEIINKLKVMELKSQETHENIVSNLQSIKNQDSRASEVIAMTSVSDFSIPDIQTSLKALEKLEQDLLQNKCDKSELEDSLANKQQKLSKSISNLEGVYQGLLHKIKSKENFVKKLADQLAQADPVAKDLAIVTENLGKMSLITGHMTPSDLVATLDNLIKDTKDIMDTLVVRVKTDGVTKISTEIETESVEIEEGKNQLKKMEDQKKELFLQQGQVVDDYVKVRTESKEAHNKVVIFKSARLNVVAAYEKYQQEKKFIESKNMDAKVLELQEVNDKIGLKRTELNSMSLEYSKLSDGIGQSFEEYEEYKNNIQIRDVLKQLNKIDSKISSMDSMEDASRLIQLDLQLKDLTQRGLELRDKRSMIAGSRIQIDREMARVKIELKGHSNTNSQYATSLGKVACNKIIISDLEKLKVCFQQSITTFHSQMIVKINEVLRVRWRQIYQGSDIDHIELVDEEITRGKDKKAFNYHIALRKKGIRMKMREKSSAGQKALASIIIRMTLAELFVKDFAFIALDEPTANLDHANVQSLAKAIGNYVKRRTNKGINIQWIIITHDEHFLKALDSECSPYFYRVQLDNEGCSKIVKISYQDVQNSIPNSLESSQSTIESISNSNSKPK